MDNDPLGRWPRRLLHVKTMTSCPWETGNSYRGVREPLYNVITYSWGRFAYFDKTERGYSNASYLALNGITWQDDMPRMKSQFDARQLEKIIQIAANSSDTPGDNIGRVEFIWLDIACINQSKIGGERVDEYFSEIGRQANIFRNANCVFAWLHSFSSGQLSKYVLDLDDLVDRMTTEQYGTGSTEIGRKGWAIEIRTFLAELTQDHWFTSLWTLQEAFLSSEARILCADGWTSESAFVRLGHISLWWNIIYGIVDRSHSLDHVELHGLKQEITAKLGFLEATRGQNIQAHLRDQPGRGNSLFLLTASHYRTVRAENINDNIYGIMQVYDLKLGKSSPRHKDGTEYSLDDLEDQLGAGILAKFPIASQLVVQSGNCPSGKAWRVNPDMTVPPVALTYWKKMVSRSIDVLVSSPSARLVAERNPSTGALWVRFYGYTSLLDSLMQHGSTAVGIAKVHSFPLMQVEFDESWLSKFFSERGQQEPQSNIGLLTWLHETHYHRLPILLLLGRTCLPPKYVDPEEFETLDWGISLILVRASRSSNSYVRVGFIIWKLSWLRVFEQRYGVILPHACKEYLDGHGCDWQVEEGFFE